MLVGVVVVGTSMKVQVQVQSVVVVAVWRCGGGDCICGARGRSGPTPHDRHGHLTFPSATLLG